MKVSLSPTNCFDRGLSERRSRAKGPNSRLDQLSERGQAEMLWLKSERN